MISKTSVKKSQGSLTTKHNKTKSENYEKSSYSNRNLSSSRNSINGVKEEIIAVSDPAARINKRSVKNSHMSSLNKSRNNTLPSDIDINVTVNNNYDFSTIKESDREDTKPFRIITVKNKSRVDRK